MFAVATYLLKGTSVPSYKATYLFFVDTILFSTCNRRPFPTKGADLTFIAPSPTTFLTLLLRLGVIFSEILDERGG